MRLSFIFILLVYLTCPAQHIAKIQKAFEVAEVDLIPEGISYDATSGSFFVGSIYKKKIIKIDPTGKVNDFIPSGKYGNWSYLGIKADPDNKVLWACRSQIASGADSIGNSGLFKYDIKNGQLIKKYIVPKSETKHLLNDITLHQGDVYITDSEGGGLYVLKKGADSLTPFIEPKTFIYPNGVTLSPDSKSIIVATVRGLQKVDLKTKEVIPLSNSEYYITGIDGLYTYKGALIGLQSVIKPESIYRFKLNSGISQIDEIEIISTNEAFYNKITTGAIKDNWLYFISNSYVHLFDEEGNIKDKSKLKNLVVYKVRLD